MYSIGHPCGLGALVQYTSTEYSSTVSQLGIPRGPQMTCNFAVKYQLLFRSTPGLVASMG